MSPDFERVRDHAVRIELLNELALSFEESGEELTASDLWGCASFEAAQAETIARRAYGL